MKPERRKAKLKMATLSPAEGRPGTFFRISVFGIRILGLAIISANLGASAASTAVLYETTSPYHHIRVLEEAGLRTMCFDDALESRMSVRSPLEGHFEYTEYFHLAWLWNTQITSVVIVGLGGGSAQRAFEYYYPNVTIETAEIDPIVVDVAEQFFGFKTSERQKVQVSDGRLFLRRNTKSRDLIILDAYVQGRYGSAIPQHLATKEFFEIVRDRLTTNGIMAYNVIGSVNDWHAEIVGAIYRTLKTVFPQVYLFPAKTSRNIVLLATKAPVKADIVGLRYRATLMAQGRQLRIPGILQRLDSFHPQPPPSVTRSPVLTDDYAPVEGLAAAGDGVDSGKARNRKR